MQKYQILCLIPFVIMYFWAVINTLRHRQWLDAWTQFFTGAVLLLNAMIIYQEMCGYKVPIWMQLAQLVGSTMIIPMAYSYFGRKLGRAINNGTTRLNWILMALLLIPSLNISLTPWLTDVPEPHTVPFYIQLLMNGEPIYLMSVPSLILLIQALNTSVRIPHTSRTMKQYGLTYTHAMRSFLIWWGLAIVFVLFTSLMPMSLLELPRFSWFYFIIYGLMTGAIYLHMALRLDINPVQSEEGDSVVIDDFVQQNKDLADRARRLFMEERLYLQPGLVIEDVVSVLGTNRTYFTRMMRAEFGMTFNEYITYERVRYAENLLQTTDKSLEEIAEESGFGNTSSLNRVFKRITSLTPDAWRRSNQLTA